MATTIEESLKSNLAAVQTNLDAVRDSLTRVIRDADKALLNSVQESIRQEERSKVKQIEAATPPSPEERRALIEYAFALEADMLTNCAAATLLLERKTKGHPTIRKIHWGIFIALIVLFFPTLIALVLGFGWKGDNYPLWLVIAAYAIAGITCYVSGTLHENENAAIVTRFAALKVAFNALAAKARRIYMVDAFSMTTKEDFSSRVTALNDDRKELTRDPLYNNYHPDLMLLESAKTSIQETLNERVKPIVRP